MKKRVFLILFLIITPILNATIYKDSGAFGSLGLSYLSDKYSSDSTESSSENFLQEYKLGYKGIIYSPKLLDYSILGTLRYEDISTDISGVASDTKSDSQDYKINLNFLRESKIPFKVYAQKSDRPISVVYANTVNRSLQDSQSAGISGAVNLNIFDLTYSVSSFSGKYESLLSTEIRDTKTYRTSLRKNEKNYSFQLNYSNVKQIIEKEYVDGNKTILQSAESNIDLRYVWGISDALKLNTYSYYRDNEAFSTATASASVNLSWNPKTEHRGSISIDIFNIEDDYDGTQSININQSYGYSMTKNLNFTQRANYNKITSGSIIGETMSLGSGINYVKAISKDTKINCSANANARSNSNDSNTSSLSSITYTYSGRAGVRQNLNSINSKLNMNLGYYGSTSSLSDSSDRYNAGLSLTTTFFSLIKNHFNSTYYKEETKLNYLNTSITRDVSRITIDDNIKYSTRIGIKGRISTNVGISYSNIKNESETITRTMPKCDIKFRYKLRPKLRFDSGFHIDKDLTYDIMNYSLDSKLAFSGRMTSVSIGYNYNKMVAGGSGDISNRESHRMQVKFERRF